MTTREKGKKGFVDLAARRTWDKETFAKREDERMRAEAKAEDEEERFRARKQIVQRENLKMTGARAEGKLQLDKMVGKRQLVSMGAPMNKQGVRTTAPSSARAAQDLAFSAVASR